MATEGEQGQQKGGTTAQHSARAHSAPPRTHTVTPAPQKQHPHPHPAAHPKDGRLEEGERPNPDTPCNGRGNAPMQPPATPAARNAQQGMQAKGPVPGSHASTPAPTKYGQQTPAACPKDGQPRKGERLTPDAPHEGTRPPPPRGCPPATPTARNASSQERVLLGWCRARTPAPAAPGEQGQRAPAACPKDWQLKEGQRLTPDAPHKGGRYPPGQPPASPAARIAQHNMHAKGPVPGPHACTPASTACRQRIPTTCPKDGQPREHQRLTPDAPREARRRPPRGLPPATRTARKPARKSARCGVVAGTPCPHLQLPGDTDNGPRLPAPRAGSRERKSA